MSRLIRLQWLSSWRYFRAHPGQLLLAMLGLAVGVAAVVSVDIARGSIRASFEDFNARVNGVASHQLRARAGHLTRADYARLRQRFGELDMAPVLESRARGPNDKSYQVLGIDVAKEGRFRDLGGAWLGRAEFDLAAWFGGADMVLAPESLRPFSDGGRQVLVVGSKTVRAQVVGYFDPARYPGSERLLLVDIGTLGRWLDAPDRISRVDLIASPAQASDLAAALPAALELRPLEGASEVRGMSAAFELNLLALSLLALLVGAFIVFNTMRFFVLQRRRLFGLKRLMGLSSGRITAWIGLEAAALGLAGTALGAALGVALADAVLAQMAATVNALYYDVGTGRVAVAPLTWFKALAVGLAGTLGAAGLPAREAAKAEVLSTLTPWDGGAGAIPRYWVRGAAALALGAVALLSMPGLVPALGAIFCLALGYILAAVPLVWSFAGRVRAGAALGRAPLTAFALSRVPHTMNRTGAALAALILAVATVVGVDHMIESFRGSVVDWLGYSLSADAYISVSDDDRRLPPGLIAAVEGTEGLAELTRFHVRSLGAGEEAIALSAQTLNARAQDSYRFIAGEMENWESLQRADLALISEPLARRRGLAPGDRLALPAPGGDRAFTVMAVFQDYRADGGRAVIGLDRYRHHWRDPSLTALGLYFSPAAEPREPPALGVWLAADPGLRFAFTAGIRADSLAIFDQTFRLTEALKWLAAIVAFVGVLGALLALQLERRRESSLLAAIGLAPRERARLVLLESAALGLVAGLLALPLGALLAWLLTRVINRRAFGWTLEVDWQPGSFVLALMLALGAALAAAAYPMWRTATRPPGLLLEDAR